MSLVINTERNLSLPITDFFNTHSPISLNEAAEKAEVKAQSL